MPQQGQRANHPPSNGGQFVGSLLAFATLALICSPSLVLALEMFAGVRAGNKDAHLLVDLDIAPPAGWQQYGLTSLELYDSVLVTAMRLAGKDHPNLHLAWSDLQALLGWPKGPLDAEVFAVQ